MSNIGPPEALKRINNSSKLEHIEELSLRTMKGIQKLECILLRKESLRTKPFHIIFPPMPNEEEIIKDSTIDLNRNTLESMKP
jgi:hypothetical protein